MGRAGAETVSRAEETTWFEAGSQAAGLARAQTRSTLLVNGVDRAAITQAELLVSELVTNVVRHTASIRMGFTVTVTPNALRIEVTEDRTSPVPEHARRVVSDVPVTATSGRGMALVDWLATQWGITRRGQLTTTWFEVGLDDEGRSFVTHTDPTDTRDAGLAAAAERSQVLLRITEALGRAATPETVADVVTHTVRDHLGAVFTGIALADRDEQEMRYLSLDPLPAETAARWVVFPLDGTNPVSRVALDGEPLFHANPDEAEAGFPGIAEHMATAGTHAIAHLPLTSGGLTFGTLAVAWSQPYEVDAETRALLLIVAGYAAQALARR